MEQTTTTQLLLCETLWFLCVLCGNAFDSLWQQTKTFNHRGHRVTQRKFHGGIRATIAFHRQELLSGVSIFCAHRKMGSRRMDPSFAPATRRRLAGTLLRSWTGAIAARRI